jgi:hypothetical protein
MDPQEQAALQKMLDDAIAQRQELDVFIRHVSGRLGVATPSGPNGGGSPRTTVTNTGNHAGADPVENTVEAEYFGRNSTDAAYAILSKFGDVRHTLKTKQLYDALKKGGVQISGEDVLYRSLARSNRFRKVARGTWGLSEWYPNAPKAQRSKATNVSSLTPDEMDETSTDEDTEVQSA